MNYSNVNKEFSTFKVDAKNVGELLREIKKITQLKEYYQKHLGLATGANSKYFYDLWEFFAEKKIDLELALGNLMKKNWEIRMENEEELRKKGEIKK